MSFDSIFTSSISVWIINNPNPFSFGCVKSGVAIDSTSYPLPLSFISISNPFSNIVYVILTLLSSLCFIALVQASDTATFISSISSIEKPILLAIPEVVNLIILTKSGLALISIFIVSQAKVYPSTLNILSRPVIVKIFFTLLFGFIIYISLLSVFSFFKTPIIAPKPVESI